MLQVKSYQCYTAVKVLFGQVDGKYFFAKFDGVKFTQLCKLFCTAFFIFSAILGCPCLALRVGNVEDENLPAPATHCCCVSCRGTLDMGVGV